MQITYVKLCIIICQVNLLPNWYYLPKCIAPSAFIKKKFIYAELYIRPKGQTPEVKAISL